MPLFLKCPYSDASELVHSLSRLVLQLSLLPGWLGAGFSQRPSQEGAVGVGQLPETQARQEALALQHTLSGVGGERLGQEPGGS